MTEAITALELTRRLIAFDTVNPPGDESKCAAFLGDLLSGLGFDVQVSEFAPRRTTVVAGIGGPKNGAARPLCFTGHLDTVPLGTAPWKMDPFAGEIAKGRLYGRGASDMKSGIAAFIVAAIRHIDSLRDSDGLMLVLTAGEETGCEGAAHLVAERNLGSVKAIIVGEPTSNMPLVGHKGALWLKATTRGLTAHGSRPDLGINAIMGAARTSIMLDDFAFNCKRHEILGSPTINIGTIMGGQNINSVPDRAEMGLDIRTVPSVPFDEIKRQLWSYLSSELAELTELRRLPPVWTDPGDAWIRDVSRIAAEVTGVEPPISGATYFSDASILQPACAGAPTIILGPGTPEMAHQTDEYCYVAKIDEAVELYDRILAAFLLGTDDRGIADHSGRLGANDRG